MKKKLMDLLAKKEARKQELITKSNGTEDVAELKGINTEMETLNTEITDLRSMIDSLPEEQTEERTQTTFNPLGTYQVEATQIRTEAEDKFATLEYRKMFRDFCLRGTPVPEEFRPQVRGDAMTQTSDVSAVIPSTILNEVIRKVTEYGQIFSRVRKLSIKGGVTVPILSLAPKATWIGESATSEKQKAQANTKVSFSYYGLECKVSVSLLADTVTLTGFEGTIIDLTTEAMIQALDEAIIKGDGEGKALGITKDTRVPSGQIVTLSSADFGSWDAWKKKVFAKMPLKYKAGATFIMASGTFEGYIDGMVDANGQPVGRINYGITNGPQERFGGKEVILVEDDIVANYDDASTADVVAIYCNLKHYAINSNMQMVMFRYLDHDTNEWVDKAILIADGKLLDPYGVVIVKKGA